MAPPRTPVGHDHTSNKFGPKPITGRLTRSERDALRMAAEIYYTLDLDGVSVADMAKMQQFSGIGKATLSAWAKDGEWDTKRQDHRLRWNDELKRRLSDQLVHYRHQEFLQLKQIHDQAFLYVCGGDEGHRPAPPRNFTEAAKVYLQLDQVLATRRVELFDHVGIAASQMGQSPPAPQGPGEAVVEGEEAPQAQAMRVPHMTEDEYQELGHHLLSRGFDADERPPPRE